MMNRTLRIILISAGTVLVSIYLLWSVCYISEQSEKVCTNMNIYVTDSASRQFISVREMTALLKANAAYPIGDRVDDISTKRIEDILSKHSMVKRAECYKTPSGDVNVILMQRIPKLRVIGAENYYVDTERRSMPTSCQYAAYVPVITGRVSKRMACEELFDFVTFLEENKFWNAQIEQINVLDNKKIELIPRVGSHIILLGTLDEYEQKLDKLQKLYVDGFDRIGWKPYKVIDLQYDGQVVCRK